MRAFINLIVGVIVSSVEFVYNLSLYHSVGPFVRCSTADKF